MSVFLCFYGSSWFRFQGVPSFIEPWTDQDLYKLNQETDLR